MDSEENTLKILIATDNHIGYKESDPIRGNDSIVTFEEILQLAHEKDVDFILLGGDLFHDNKPSRKSLHSVISLLRKYCLNDRACHVEFLSDQSVNFGHTNSYFPHVNYEDPNLNVGMPVFSIHGNHDDPTGAGNLCSLDILSAAGLINYFGKYLSLDKIEISPLLMQKGTTKFALYGLGSIREERIHRMFLQKKISMLRSRDDQESWFNLFVIHQNHAKHGPTNYIPEQFLDEFIDLVFWGHEHECKIEPMWNPTQNFFVTQPGSSVATSLSEGETRPKFIGLLSIKGKEFVIEKIPLKTVRQFYHEDIILRETGINPDDKDALKKVETFCAEKVEGYLRKAAIEKSDHPRQPEKPLIRFRVDYSGGYEPFNVFRFEQKFLDKVANHGSDPIVVFKRSIVKQEDEILKTEDGHIPVINTHTLDNKGVEDMVKEFFQQLDKSKQLHLLTEKGMGEAVKEYVIKEETEAVRELVSHQLGKTEKHLHDRKSKDDLIEKEIVNYKDERKRKIGEEDEEIKYALEQSRAKRESQLDSGLNSNDENENPNVLADSMKRGKSTRGTRGGRGRGGGRGKNKNPVVPDSHDITDIFSKQKRKLKNSIDFSDEEVNKISDDEIFSRKTTASSTQKSTRGLKYDSDDETDTFFSSNKRRKR